MSLLESIVVPLGTKMPEFTVKDPSGKEFKSDNCYGEKGLLIAFTCNHCPYALAVWPRFINLAGYARELGINTIAVNPNINPDYPDDSPEKMLKKIKEWGINFPYLVDETQDAAERFKAQCTPDIYLYNARHELVYHGRIDDNWQDESKVTRQELKDALTALAADQPVSLDQKPSMGCSIKWVR
jgi:peroxiredoxin